MPVGTIQKIMDNGGVSFYFIRIRFRFFRFIHPVFSSRCRDVFIRNQNSLDIRGVRLVQSILTVLLLSNQTAIGVLRE